VLSFGAIATTLRCSGAQAVNAYVTIEDDAGVASFPPAQRRWRRSFAPYLANTFQIAVRIREVASGRVSYLSVARTKDRHLADVRHVQSLPANQIIAEVRVPTPTS